MDIRILHLLDGARSAEGLTVIIDVFRAFSLEAYLYEAGARCIIPVGTVEDAFSVKKKHPDYILAGERNGKKVEGFDLGNAPSAVKDLDVKGKTIIHTTSAGVQGLVSAQNSSEIITGALVNASAIARYIAKKKTSIVSLVAMGWNGARETEEDELCAAYIKSILEGNPVMDIVKQADELRYTEGKKFFDPAQQSVFPQGDFPLCTAVDVMDFVIHVKQTEEGLVTEREDV